MRSQRTATLVLASAASLALLAVLAPRAAAQTAPVAPAPALSAAEVEDQRFEDSIRGFGFLSGAVYQCLPASGRTAHDREVLKAYSGIVRLFGSDRAFFFAAAYGAGTGASIDKAKCASFIEDFKAANKLGGRGN